MQRQAAETIKTLGYNLVLSDLNPECACRNLADFFIPADTFDLQANTDSVNEVLKQFDVRAVFTCGADCHETVARIAKIIGCHGIDPNISHICRHKHLTRALLLGAGLPQPRFQVVSDLNEALSVINKFGNRAVIKATNNSGSRGFSIITEAEPLTQAKFDVAIDSGNTGKAIIEDLLEPILSEPSELSIETVWIDGSMVWLNWVERFFRRDLNLVFNHDISQYKDVKWGVEIGHVNPASKTEEIRLQVEKQARDSGLALRMDQQSGGHILKVDIMLTEQGPYILEITPRLSGGWDSAGSTPARGADFIGGALRMALGENKSDYLFDEYFRFGNPNLFAAVLADIPKGATDCIGRKFALGVGPNSRDALKQAHHNLQMGKFL